MRRFVNPGKRIASFTRTFARMRWAIMFDGVGVRGQLANRAINPDGDIDIEWEQLDYDTTSFGASSIVTQCLTATFASRELMLRIEANESIALYFGGNVVTTPVNFYGTGKWRITLIGSSWVVYKNGLVVYSASFTRGTAREPSAQTVIGARNNGGTFVDYKKGTLYNVKINGTRWPMADYTQAIQLQQPSGLGAELITQSVLENPAVTGTQWTYLGNGRWQYVGDGSFSELRFISAQPAQGFVEFEVEQISGQMRCVGTGGIPESFFSGVGVKRFFYKDLSAIAYVGFVRNTGVASCIIKNISFKPLGTCNPMTISNATSANWVQVVNDYEPKFRKVLRFDGVGARGVFASEIALNGDWEVKVFINPVDAGFSQEILGKELFFKIQVLTSGVIQALVGNGSSWAFILNSQSAVAFDGKRKLVRVLKSGNTYSLFIDGVLGQQFVSEASLLPTISHIGVRSTLISTSYARGLIYDIDINGVKYPIADANQTIQLPEPSGLGEELITPTVLINPMLKGTQWTYLGDGRWQYIGDGSYNPLRFISSTEQPNAAYLEYEVESITGAITTAFNNPSAVVSTIGRKRYFFTDKGVSEANVFEFKRASGGLVASCIIKNISFKPLGTCNPITLANVTSANWEDLEI